MFFTPVNIPVPDIKISHKDNIITLGSCFSENIGKKLHESGFNACINPFGTLYNPASVSSSLRRLMSGEVFDKKDIFEYKSLWSSFSHSSLFSDISAEKCLQHINQNLSYASEFLKKTHFLLITFGTAWIFEEKKSGKIAANCHKLPASMFNRRRLTAPEIVSDFSTLLSELKQYFPSLEIIFTVSPIRHVKDGLHENSLSKSTLLLAGEELGSKFPFVHYFPAYEIQLDELRDYRYYALDMTHPSEVAVDYIWKRFSETYFSAETLELKKEVEKLRADFAHRPLHPESTEYKLFLTQTEQRKKELAEKYPFIRLHF